MMYCCPCFRPSRHIVCWAICYALAARRIWCPPITPDLSGIALLPFSPPSLSTPPVRNPRLPNLREALRLTSHCLRSNHQRACPLLPVTIPHSYLTSLPTIPALPPSSRVAVSRSFRGTPTSPALTCRCRRHLQGPCSCLVFCRHREDSLVAR